MSASVSVLCLCFLFFFGCLHTRLGCIVLINRGRKKHDKMGAMLKGKMVAGERSSWGEVTGSDPRNRPPPATPALVRSGWNLMAVSTQGCYNNEAVYTHTVCSLPIMTSGLEGLVLLWSDWLVARHILLLLQPTSTLALGSNLYTQHTLPLPFPLVH